MNIDLSNIDLSNFDHILIALHPFDAPAYVPNYPKRAPGYEKLYFMLDLLDQFILLPHSAYVFLMYGTHFVVTLIADQVVWFTDKVDGNVTPLMLEFNRILRYNVSTDPAPLWFTSKLGIRDYHNWSTVYTYRFYPTYELGKTVIYDLNLRWHLTFDPSRLGALGMNIGGPRNARMPIICLGADFDYGAVKGAFNLGWKLSGNEVAVDSIGKTGVRFYNPSSAPRLGLWLTLDLYEYNSAPSPRGPINIEQLLAASR